MSALPRLPLLLLILAALSARSEEKSHPFGFAPPEITLSAVGTRNLQTGDFDQDGKLDLAVLNPGSGRVDIYLQKEEAEQDKPATLHRERWNPQLSHPRFSRESLLLQYETRALVSGDFNGDGKDDLALVHDQDRLDMYHGPMVKGWSPAASIEVPATPAPPGSLIWEPDEKTLVLLGERELCEITWSAKEKTYAKTTLANLPAGERRQGLLMLDVDGDQRKDVLYVSGTSGFNAAIHLRGENGSALLLRPQMEPESAAFLPAPGEKPSLLALHRRSPTLLQFDFQTDKKGTTSPQDGLAISFVPLGSSQAPQVQFVDVDRDGREDMLLLEKGKPELSWSKAEKDGSFTSMPSLPLPISPKWMIPGNWGLKAESPHLLLHDPESGYLGVTVFHKGRFQVPSALSNQEKILAATSWGSPKKGPDRLVGILKDEKRSYQAIVWEITTDKGTPTGLQEVERIPLPSLKRDPGSLISLPADGPAPAFFLVTNPLGGAVQLVPNESGSLKVRETEKGFSSKIVERLKEEDIQVVPSEIFPTSWVLLKGNRIQFLRLGENGQINVVDQLNLQQRGEATALLPLDEKAETIAVFDRARNRFELHARDESGIYRYQRFLPVPPLQFQQARLTQHPATGDMTLRIQGRTQSMLVQARSPRIGVRSVRLYESDLPDTRPSQITLGDFNGDGQQDILLVDAVTQHTLELLEQTNGTWESKMHFPIFETAPGAGGIRGGAREPRELKVADVNGDGLDDLLLLIHDRILLYLQDPLPQP